MKIKLSKVQLSFLEGYLKKEYPNLFDYLHNNVVSSVFEIDDDHANDIRDWLGDKLQVIGFDENYELTDTGKVIDELVDIFYGK